MESVTLPVGLLAHTLDDAIVRSVEEALEQVDAVATNAAEIQRAECVSRTVLSSFEESGASLRRSLHDLQRMIDEQIACRKRPCFTSYEVAFNHRNNELLEKHKSKLVSYGLLLSHAGRPVLPFPSSPPPRPSLSRSRKKREHDARARARKLQNVVKPAGSLDITRVAKDLSSTLKEIFIMQADQETIHAKSREILDFAKDISTMSRPFVHSSMELADTCLGLVRLVELRAMCIEELIPQFLLLVACRDLRERVQVMIDARRLLSEDPDDNDLADDHQRAVETFVTTLRQLLQYTLQRDVVATIQVGESLSRLSSLDEAEMNADAAPLIGMSSAAERCAFEAAIHQSILRKMEQSSEDESDEAELSSQMYNVTVSLDQHSSHHFEAHFNDLAASLNVLCGAYEPGKEEPLATAPTPLHYSAPLARAPALALFPDEVWLIILSFASARTKARLRQVCRDTRRIASDVSLWRTLGYEAFGRRPGGWGSSFTTPPYLRGLRKIDVRGDGIFSLNITDREMNVLTGACPGLTHVDVSGHSIGDISLHYLATRCLSLSSIVVEKCNITDRGLASLAHLVSLHELSIRQNAACTSRGVEALFARGNGVSLHVLNVRGCPRVTNSAIKAVAAGAPYLYSVDLTAPEMGRSRDKGVTDSSISVLAGSCAHLTSIDLTYNDRLTDAAVVSLRACENLTSLDLFGCHRITSKSILALEGLPLQKLNVALSSVHNDSLTMLSGFLKSLSLHGCVNVSDKGMRHLCAAAPHLVDLDVSGTAVGNSGLVLAAAELCFLEDIDVRSLDITPDTLSAMLRKGISVVYDDSDSSADAEVLDWHDAQW